MTSGTADKAELLNAVRQMRGVLTAQIADEERAGKLSCVTHDALYESGVLRMKLPRELGGYEADLPTQFEVLEALAMFHPAAAWCAMVGTTSIGMPGAFLSDAGAEKVFGDGIPRGAILIMPTGTGVPTDKGFRLNGRWAFASGIHHADWVAAQAMVETGAGDKAVHMFVLPASAVTIHDNWQVMGLRSTGSCDILVEDVFVPADCVWNVETQQPRRGGPLYRLGIPAFVAYEHAAFAIGVARGVLDDLRQCVGERSRGYGPNKKSLSQREIFQHYIGHAELKLRAARSQALEFNADAMAAVASGNAVSTTLALDLRANAASCTEVAVDVVRQAFRFAGGRALHETDSIQRCLRDLEAAAQHLMVSETAFGLRGRVLLGDDSVMPMG